MTFRNDLLYNVGVKRKTTFLDAVHMVRFAAFLWIGYLAVLAIINQSLWDPRQVNFNTLFYYLLLVIVALICLLLTYWTWIQDRLGTVFLPLIIGIMTVLPILATWGIIQLFPRTPMLDPQSSVLRLIPFFLVSFLLVAWRYRWPYILLIILAIAALNLGIIWSFPSREPGPFRGALSTTLIQTVVFLAVGFFISFLMSRIRKQQQSLEEANLSLKHYASTLDQLATTRERSRLSRELHDTLAHTLSGLAVQLETVKAYWDVDRDMSHSSLEASLATAHSGLEETRRALKALRASPLDDLGFTGALRKMIQDTATRANLNLSLSMPDNLPVLSPDVEQCIYRITQEAITNVVNHAQAKNLNVKLEIIRDKLILTIQDNGVGFSVEKSKYSSRLGLTGMRDRAELIGGILDIVSQPGLGTMIRLSL
jgi:signal transduction histidine kinase